MKTRTILSIVLVMFLTFTTAQNTDFVNDIIEKSPEMLKQLEQLKENHQADFKAALVQMDSTSSTVAKDLTSVLGSTNETISTAGKSLADAGTAAKEEASGFIDKHGSSIGNFFEKIANTLSDGAKHIYKVFVMQAVVIAAKHLLYIILAIVALFIARKQYRAFHEKFQQDKLLHEEKLKQEEKDDSKVLRLPGEYSLNLFESVNGILSLAVPAICIVLAGTLFMSADLGLMLQGFINPEYVALKEIFGFIMK